MTIPQKNETFLLSYEIRILILGIAVLISAIVAGLLFNGLLHSSPVDAPVVLFLYILTAAVFLFMVTAMAITALFVKLRIVYLFFAAAVLALFLPSILTMNKWHWFAASFLFLWITRGCLQIRRDAELLVKPKVGLILKRGVKKILGGLMIFIVVFYLFSPRMSESEDLFFSRGVFEIVFTPLAKIVQIFAPQFKPDMTVDEAILEIAGEAAFKEALKKELWAKEAPVLEIENLKKRFFEQFKEKIPEQRQEIAKQLGVILKGEEKIAVVFYDFILVKIKGLPAQTRILLNIFSALALYFILKIAAIPFGWLARILAAGLFKLMIAARFLTIKKQMIEREIAEL